MKESTNAYFQSIYRKMRTFSEETSAHEAKKVEIMKNGTPEDLVAWKEREKELVFPLSNGEFRAYYAWDRNYENGSDIFEVDDLPWINDMHDYIECIRAAGVEEIVITDQSTALMKSIHHLVFNEGCLELGLVQFGRVREQRGKSITTVVQGIKLKV